MPVRRRRSFRRGGSSRRRKLVWAQRVVSAAFTANNSWQNIDLLQDYKALAGSSSVGVTIMRTHLLIVPTVAPTGSDIIGIGLHVDDLDQVTGAPTTNVMVANVRDNPGIDWAWNTEYIADAAGFLTPAYGGIRLDVRSKRRLEEVQQAWLLNILQASVAAPAVAYNIYARTLLALP